MRNYELLEVDPSPCGNGLPEKKKLVAVSTNYKKLADYCEKKYKKKIGSPEKFSWDIYYVIENTNIIII